ncbi:unnamed protein product [Spirodela intermedia]|uniref:Uncharacterized protein n=1 Tax=Spirodela intermedia TaxID=51605 RepID=A0A7I8L6K6_SPIIN|nr:unnamed protein product [Spirodela intermedia]
MPKISPIWRKRPVLRNEYCNGKTFLSYDFPDIRFEVST